MFLFLGNNVLSREKIIRHSLIPSPFCPFFSFFYSWNQFPVNFFKKGKRKEEPFGLLTLKPSPRLVAKAENFLNRNSKRSMTYNIIAWFT